MNISFLIVAIGPSDYLLKVFDSIEKSISSYSTKYSYEILVCSPNEIKYKNVVWVEDKIKQSGNTVPAYNEMVKRSTGEYLFLLNDDHMFPNSNPLNAIRHLESTSYKRRKYKVTSIGASATLNLAHATAVPNMDVWSRDPSRFSTQTFPIELQNPRFCTLQHRYLIMGYPVIARETIVNHFGGYFLNPSFKHHWADNWLPFFIGETDRNYSDLICLDTPLQWCPHGDGATSEVINDVYDYQVFCKLAVKLINEGCNYYDLVNINE